MIEQNLNQELFDYEIIYTEYQGHATEIAKNAVAKNIDVVCAVGGDGSMNEVATALVNTNTYLAIIPAGSGNGLARHLHIPLDTTKAIQFLNTSTPMAIDTVKINQYTMVGTAGIGFDAKIAHTFLNASKRGFKTYIRLVLREFFKYQPQLYEYICNGITIKERAFTITIANSSQWGNGATIAPNANIQDGKLDICILKPFRTRLAPGIVFKLFKGKLNNSKYYSYTTCSSLEIKNTKAEIHIDGEPLNIEGDILVKINPKSLNIYT